MNHAPQRTNITHGAAVARTAIGTLVRRLARESGRGLEEKAPVRIHSG